MLLWGEEGYQQKKVLHEAYDDSDCKIFIKCHNKKAKQETSILQIKKNEKKRNFLHLITFFISIFAAHSIKTDCKTFENFAQSSLNHHLGTTTSKAILLRASTLVQAFTYRIVACGEPRLRMTKVCAFLFI